MEGKITSLRFQKRNSEWVNVYLDDRFAFSLAAIRAAGLRVGQLLTAQEVAELRELDTEERAYERALGLLSHRPRSTAELSRRLRRADFPDSAIDAALARLQGLGLVDDLAFARYWVRNREEFRPRGARMLRWELQQKGISSAIIDRVLEPVNEVDSALRLARKRAGRLRRLDETTFRQRLSAYLGRRGFSYAVVTDVVRQVWQETDESLPSS